MATTRLYTVKDGVENLLDFLGENPGAKALRDCRRALAQAYREVPSLHHWSYFYQQGRVNVVAPQSTGTVTYTHTGGDYERVLTLAGATWPLWAARGAVAINNTPYEVDQRKSDTLLTLNSNSNPGADVAAGTAYQIFQDTYALPPDFVSAGLFNTPWDWPAAMVYVAPEAWLNARAINVLRVGVPRLYTIGGDPDFMGALALRLWPASDRTQVIDFIYQRKPRPFVLDAYQDGTASLISGSATVAGQSTAWSTRLIGSVFRASATAVDYPTGVEGVNPSPCERIVVDVPDAETLTLDAAAQDTLVKVKYIVSDPIDLDDGALLNLFIRCAEHHLATSRNMERQGKAQAEFKRALIEAKETDSRSFTLRHEGARAGNYLRLRDFPRGADVS